MFFSIELKVEIHYFFNWIEIGINVCRHTIHKKSNTFSCAECDYATPGKSSLKHHMERHTNTPLTPNLLPKVACCEPHIINPPPNDHLLENHSMLDQNTQHGFELSLTDVPDEVHQFFKRNNHGVQTKIFDKFTSKIFITFMTQKPSTDDQESTFGTSTTPTPLLLIPLPMPMRISFVMKPMLSRSTSLFLSFCNTERLESSNITMPATTTNYYIPPD